ncbi:unnamed protein product [Bursaphelenchus okinawaensis]|uniref:Uncharacterized protein n=1 Tax=Bursaphelenchus okinawaensis TaxID=465554 RepID=A0A811LWY8_9BILA|nr:unnamed protein product [Bursaphelenchus okinawaensis]CAG9128585.1 unnamed protein product [Bursaphelenchus okinawaensis]
MSHYYIIKQFLPTMIERNEGHIVATCSAAGHICPAEIVDYTGSKFAVRGYMEALYHQMLAAGHNIEFTTICPWYVKSPMFKQEEHPNMAFNACDCEEMVERSIKAIRLNEKEIIFPAHINIFPILRGIFPICVGRSVLLRKLCYS